MTWMMKRSIKAATVVFASCFGLVATVDTAAAAETYLLGIGACPAWVDGAAQDMAEATSATLCEADVERVEEALSARFEIRPDNRYRLIQAEATPMRFFNLVEGFKQQLGEDDTLILYQISHGGITDYLYQGYPASGEVFAYYTETKPQFSTAVEEGHWLSARDMRDAIYQLGAKTGADILIIIESCHAGQVTKDLVNNPALNLAGPSRIAFLFSAGPGELSLFNTSVDGGLFSEVLAKQLAEAPRGQNMADVFAQTRETTHRAALATCNAVEGVERETLFSSSSSYFYRCTQEPEFVDPRGLLLDLKLN